jgi:hypothetical protein
MKRHHDYQRSLRYVDVRFPFAKALAEALPRENVSTRRTIRMVLTVVEVIAYLHQHTRGRNEHGQLEATLEDYEVARRLLLGPLATALGHGLVERKYLEAAKTLPKGQFDSNEALKVFTNKMTRDRTLQALCKLGVLRQVAEGSSHAPARWEWTGVPLEDVILPSVKTVEEALRKAAAS